MNDSIPLQDAVLPETKPAAAETPQAEQPVIVLSAPALRHGPALRSSRRLRMGIACAVAAGAIASVPVVLGLRAWQETSGPDTPLQDHQQVLEAALEGRVPDAREEDELP